MSTLESFEQAVVLFTQQTWTEALRWSVAAADAEAVKVMTLRRPDTCSDCGVALRAGERAVWEAGTRVVTCLMPRRDVAPTRRGHTGSS